MSSATLTRRNTQDWLAMQQRHGPNTNNSNNNKTTTTTTRTKKVLETNNNDNNNSSRPTTITTTRQQRTRPKSDGLIKLADTLRDTLAVERRLAKQELGLYKSNTKPSQNEPRRRTVSTGEASYMRSTLADQRRHSTTPKQLQLQQQQQASIKEDVLKSKRRSILAAATVKAKQLQQEENEEKKKSIETALATRRRSRTESLKQGVPTEPLAAAKLVVRRKSLLLKQEEVEKKEEQQQQQQQKRPVRKRGKTLPGNLAEPPKIQSLQLPPMKVEPIKLNIPANNSRKASSAKSPSAKSIRTTTSTTRRSQSVNKPKRLSTGTTPDSTTSTSSSSSSASSIHSQQKHTTTTTTTTTTIATATATATNSKKLNTRKVKGQSHLGISTMTRTASRNSSISSSSSKTLLLTPTSAKASPRVQPRPSSIRRRQSLAPLDTNNGRVKRDPDRRQSLAPLNTNNNNANKEKRRQSLAGNDARPRKQSTAIDGILTSRKHSVAVMDDRHRATSLKEKLEAMVAEHAMKEDIKHSTSTTKTHKKKKQDTLSSPKPPIELVDDQTMYLSQFLSPEDRARPQRIKDTLMMWDKEMVEALSPDIAKTPHMAIKFYGHHLSKYELDEILNYDEIYFVGHQSAKIQSTTTETAANFGYDDDKGDYKLVLNDHLAYRYEIMEELGQGSFGQVIRCFDHKTQSTVAIKLIRNKKRFYAQAKTEVKILGHLVDWDPEDRCHNVRMTDHFYFRHHLCIASECLSMNLYEFIKVNNFQGFHLTLIKRFAIQLLRSLSLLYRHGVVHCDLKPENILLKHPTKSTIKVIDFGSSCLENERVYTYIQSRFYRAPEIILGLNYSMAIDMWSLGCILAELYTGIPLFPGENEQEQLACIMEVIGVPELELIQKSERKHLFFDSRGHPRIVSNSRGKKRRAGTKTLHSALRCSDALFIDFLSKCLQWDPKKRLNPEEAFQHEWIVQRPNSVRHPSVASLRTDDHDSSSTRSSSRKDSIPDSIC